MSSTSGSGDDVFRIIADNSQAIRAYAEMGAAGKKSFGDQSKGAESMTSAFLKANITIEAARKVWGLMTGELERGYKLALDNERTNLKLAAALKGAGYEASNYTGILNQQSAELQKLTGISDEQIRTMQALAINTGVSAGEADEFVRAAIRMSNVTGKDATESLKQLTKTLSGTSGELKEAVPGVERLTEKQLRNGDAVKIVNELWGDQLGLLTEGTAGSQLGLTNAWSNLVEQMGLAVTQGGLLGGVFDSLAGYIQKTATNLETFLDDLNGGGSNAKGISAQTNDMIAFMKRFGMSPGEARELGISREFQDQLAKDFPSLFETTKSMDRQKAAGNKRSGGAAGKEVEIDFGADLGEGFVAGVSSTGLDFLDGIDKYVLGTIQGWEDAEGAAQDMMEGIREDESTQWKEALDERVDMEKEAADKRIELEKKTQDKLIKAQKQAEEVKKFHADMALDHIGQALQDVSSLGIDALFTMAEGGQIAFDQLLIGFLRSTGQSLIGQGIAHTMTGIGELIMSTGANPKAHALIAHGAAEIAIGTGMTAGALIGTSMGGGRGGGGGGGMGGGTGGAGGGVGPTAPVITPALNDHVVINVIGDLSDRDAEIIERGISRRRLRGTGS